MDIPGIFLHPKTDDRFFHIGGEKQTESGKRWPRESILPRMRLTFGKMKTRNHFSSEKTDQEPGDGVQVQGDH